MYSLEIALPKVQKVLRSSERRARSRRAANYFVTHLALSSTYAYDVVKSYRR